MDKLKVGLIGLGRLGREHASNIHYKIPQAELTAICSSVQEEVESVASEMKPKFATNDYREILSNKELDAIVIASSSDVHSIMICEACQAGVKNVYTEKPMGMTLAEIEEIKDAVAANEGMVFQVGYMRRFDTSYQAAKKKIDEGFIGKPITIKMVNRDPDAMAKYIIGFSETSGGIIMDMLTHDYDCARWLINSDAKSVYGLGGTYKYHELVKYGDFDNCSLLVEFKNGVMGQFEASRNSTYGFHAETEIFGTEGSIRIGITPYKDRVTYMDSGGINVKGTDWFYEYFQPCYQAELEHFFNCVRTQEQPLIGVEDGYKTVQWAYAATNAVKKGKIITLE
ncbi:Gfo/Idh/MocA family protein [Dethiobacter alkaliphilus]|uniref:Gfo/Idh/MocA family protein n=1 Tax=Dethiobacter alkaliphilus TaxID=427926 RepID=UPI002227E40F|nr:Gfo/Idh/MocA family oxidoreductase [Dethiobacter alkaliphilus]MCW3489986.1 Gfo/Idh/MocA family oxidoreductase [Dethiobacter alkaliphilus]